MPRKTYEERYLWPDGDLRAGKIVAQVMGLAFVIAVAVTAISYAQGWLGTAADTVGPANVKAQYDAVITDWQALSTAADNACSATQQASRTTASPTLVEDPAQAYAATYRDIVVDYNSRMADIFKAKIAGPSGYPSSIPAFPNASGAKPNWCGVPADLAMLRK